MQYCIEARQFIESVIRQRKLILKQEAGRKDAVLMQNYIIEIERYLKTFKYDKNINMAKFFNWQREKIYDLIPGRTNQTKRHHDYDLLLTRTENILEYAEAINPNPQKSKSRIPVIS